jgi:hypothetical protein
MSFIFTVYTHFQITILQPIMSSKFLVFQFIRYLDQLSRKMSCNEDEMEDNQKQFLFHLSQELTSEIKRMEDDYKDLI